MASRSLEIALKLFVQGGGDVKTLGQQVQQLKREIDKIDGSATLDKLFKRGVTDIDALIRKAFELQRALGKPVKLDFDLTRPAKEVDLLVQKGRQVIDVLAQAGRQKLDLNLAQVNRQLDLTVQKGRQIVDVFANAGRTRLDLNLGTIVRDANRATEAVKNHRASLHELASTALFVRRAFLGFGSIFFVREILDVVKAYDQARQGLLAIFPDQAVQQFAFIKEQADRLGVSVTGLALQYTKFSAAAKALGLDQQLVRDNFLAVAEAGAKLALSSDQIEGALTAIQQIASKGRLSMEELRQQLGDRIPGAISIAAKGLGLTEQRLFALVEAGKITSEQFLKTFPDALRAAFGTDVTTRIDTTSAAIARFQNSLRELTDSFARAGALDAFTSVLSGLAKFFQDPQTVQAIKDFSQGILSLTKFILDNISAIKQLTISLAALFIFSKVGTLIAAFAASMQKLAATFPGVGAGAAGAAASVKAYAAIAGEGRAATTSFVGALASLAAATKNPIVLTVAGLAALDATLIQAYIDKLDKARESALALAESQRELASAERLVKVFLDQAAALDDLSNASEAVILSQKEINSLSAEGLRSYNDSVIAAQKLADLEIKATEQQIKGLQLRIKAFAESNNKTDEAIRQNQTYKTQLEDANTALTALRKKLEDFGQAQEDVNKRSKEANIALDAYNEKLQRAADFALMLSGRIKQGSQEGLIGLKDLSKEAQLLVDGFKNIIVAGKDAGEAFKQLFPKDLGDATVTQLQDVGNALAFIKQEALATGKQIEEGLAQALEKLTGAELNRFAIQAQRAFDTLKLSAQGFAVLLDGQLRASLKNLGLDADDAGKKVSKGFKEILENLRAVGSNALVTGDQLKGALDVSLQAAKTKEELLALKATMEELGAASGKFADQLSDSLLRLDDRIRLSGATLDSALGDSFQRLGVQAKTQLNAIAEQARVDFERIRQSGQASTIQLEEAFRKFAEQATAANNGIPPISLKFEAIQQGAFDVVVEAAQDASTRVRKAIESAIPLAETKQQLQALSEAITVAFDKGKITVEEFGKLATEVGFKLRDAIAKPVGELAAAADLLGVKTKEQLQATADNAREAFQTIASSGQFTNAELAKGAQQFMDAYIAANNGVVDSFDPVVQRAQQVLAGINETSEALEKMNLKALEPITTGINLSQMGVGELQQFLSDTVKAYRAIGIQNVEQLQIVQETQKWLQRAGEKNSEDLRKKWEDTGQILTNSLEQATVSLTNAADTLANPGAKQPPSGTVAPRGGLPGNNNNNQLFRQPVTVVNINGTNLSPDEVKRKILPVFAKQQQRQR